MQIVLKFLPPPSKKGQGPQDVTDWNPSLRTIEADHLHEIQFNCMPDLYKAQLNDLEADWSDLKVMPNQVFLDHLRKIELF